MIKAIIIDDERKSREVLRLLLQDYPEIQLIGEADSVETGVTLLKEKNPDIVFLDIKLHSDVGFSILDQLPDKKFEVIFVTSYDNYALKAIKYAAFDYLLKPIDLDDLNAALFKLKSKLKDKKNSLQPLVVHSNNTVKLIEWDEIYYIIADGVYSNVYISNGCYPVSKTLKDIEEVSLEYKKFIRISRGVLINAVYIKEYSKGQYFSVTMVDQKIFEVSRRKKTEVLEKIRSIQ